MSLSIAEKSTENKIFFSIIFFHFKQVRILRLQTPVSSFVIVYLKMQCESHFVQINQLFVVVWKFLFNNSFHFARIFLCLILRDFLYILHKNALYMEQNFYPLPAWILKITLQTFLFCMYASSFSFDN